MTKTFISLLLTKHAYILESLMNFVTNIHSHFAIRRSTIIMKKSRNIIDKDMLNAIEVSILLEN